MPFLDVTSLEVATAGFKVCGADLKLCDGDMAGVFCGITHGIAQAIPLCMAHYESL